MSLGYAVLHVAVIQAHPAIMIPWPDYSLDIVRRRYDRLAAIYPVFDWVFWLPRDLRARGVSRLELRAGQRALEVGCGTGLCFRPLLESIGPRGHLCGVDASAGMLRRARRLCARREWHNVTLLCCDAADYRLSEPVDGVLFSLSYGVMPDPQTALRRAWMHLRPGGRIVIVSARTPVRGPGRWLSRFGVWLSRATVLGDPDRRPWDDLRALTDRVELEELPDGIYYICRGTKATGPAAPDPLPRSRLL